MTISHVTNLGIDPLLNVMPPEATIDDPRQFYLREQWYGLGDYIVTAATSGTAVPGGWNPSVLVVSAGAATQGQGVTIQSRGSIFVPADNRTIVLSAKVKLVSPTTSQFFFGLSVYDTTLIASNENSSANHIGFEMGATSQAANAGKLQFYTESGGTRTTVANVHTLVADTYVRLGIKIIGTSLVEIYVDDVLVGTSTTNIPTSEMSLSIVNQANGTTEPVLSVKDLYAIISQS